MAPSCELFTIGIHAPASVAKRSANAFFEVPKFGLVSVCAPTLLQAVEQGRSRCVFFDFELTPQAGDQQRPLDGI